VKRLSGLGAWLMCLLVGAVMVSIAAVPSSFWTSDGAHPAVEALADRSVYVDPKARGVLDERVARRLVGKRNILVAVFPESATDQAASLCEEIVHEHDDALALVYAGTTGPTICAGGHHEVPLPDSATEWGQHILLAADFARDAKSSPDDVRTELAEFVRAYDVAARADLPWGAPPRHEHRTWGTWTEVFDALGGMACGVLMLFWCAVVGFWRFRDFLDAWRERRVARAEAIAGEWR
jgi:hypothetical protein